jgi:sulfite exporter TauE/SafE
MLSEVLKVSLAGLTMGWGPCLAYMAPILLPYIGATKKSWKQGLKVALLFSLGRLVAFSILGGLATIAFHYINRLFPPHVSSWLYLAVGVFMVVMGILIVLGKGFGIHIKESLLEKSSYSMIVFGFLIGIAPCVPYIAILTYIACIAEENILTGVVYAAVFAAGAAVAPIVLGGLTGFLSQKIYYSMKLRKAFQMVCGAVLVIFGARFIYYVLRVAVG